MGPYRTTADVVADFAADPSARPVLTGLDQPGIGEVISAHGPSRWDSSYSGSVPAAGLGADTDTVLAQVLGLSEDELRRMHDDGVIA